MTEHLLKLQGLGFDVLHTADERGVAVNDTGTITVQEYRAALLKWIADASDSDLLWLARHTF